MIGKLTLMMIHMMKLVTNVTSSMQIMNKNMKLKLKDRKKLIKS